MGTAFADPEKQNTETFVGGTTASEIDFPVEGFLRVKRTGGGGRGTGGGGSRTGGGEEGGERRRTGGGRERVEGGQSLLTLKPPSSSRLIPLAFQVAPLPCWLLPLPASSQQAWLSLGSSHGVPVFSLVAEMGL